MALFVQLDVNWPDNVKVIRVGLEGAGLHAMAMCLAKRTETDGVIHRTQLYRFGATDELIELLVSEGLLDVVDYGKRVNEDADLPYTFRVHDWHSRNLSQSELGARRSEAGRRGNHVRYRHSGTFAECPKCSHSEEANTQADVATVAKTSQKNVAKLAKLATETETETETEIASETCEPSKRHSKPAPAKRARDELWDAVAEAIGPANTRTEQSNRGRTVSELRAAGATPDDVIARCREYRRRYKDASLTDAALRKHWSDLAPKQRALHAVDGPIIRGPAAV